MRAETRGVAVLLAVAGLAIVAALVVAGWSDGQRSGPWGGRPAAASPATPIRVVPGAASATGRDAQLLSTDPASLGLGAFATDDGLGPPSWVRPGTRLTFYSAAASVAQSRFAWVEDPNGPWEDPATGQHYRRTDETGESMGTASGDGVGQVDVQAVDGADVALSLTLYGIDHEHRVFVPGITTGASVPGAEIDGLWVNPTRLAQLQDVRANGVLVLRGDYPLGGRTYHAVSFAVTTPGAYQQYTYDTESGVLLSATTSTAGATSPVSAPGEAPPQGNTQLTVSFFAGVRQRSVPGADGATPDWLAHTTRLDYAGTYSWVNPVDPSSGTFTSPMTMGVSLGRGGGSWAPYAAQTAIQGLGSTTGSGITGPTGLYWLSPTALSALAARAAAAPGQVVDQDPITGEQLVVEGGGRDASGRTFLTLVSRLPGITTRAGYDTTSGVLAAYAAQVPGTGTTIDLHLQRGP